MIGGSSLLYKKVTLDQFDVYTLEGTNHIVDAFGIGGWRIDTSRPVTVIAGAPCVNECTGGGACPGGQAWASVLEDRELGRAFASFPITNMLFGESDRNLMTTELIITSTHNKNDIHLPGIDNTERINEGDWV